MSVKKRLAPYAIKKIVTENVGMTHAKYAEVSVVHHAMVQIAIIVTIVDAASASLMIINVQLALAGAVREIANQ